jgi:hypothetical protein
MREMISVALVLALMLFSAAAAPSGAADKCAAQKKGLDDAWAEFVKLDAKVAKAAEAFRLAKEIEIAADRAFLEALQAVEKATADWKAAINVARDCIAKNPETKCKIEIQAARDAVKVLAKAEAHRDNCEQNMHDAPWKVQEKLGALDAANKAWSKGRDKAADALLDYIKCYLGAKLFAQ